MEKKNESRQKKAIQPSYLVSKDCIPFKLIRRKLKNHFDGEISEKSIRYVRELIDYILSEIAELSLIELQEHNRLRRIQHLPELKRISFSIMKKITIKVFKSSSVFIEGKVGDTPNRNTTLSHNKQDIEVV